MFSSQGDAQIGDYYMYLVIRLADRKITSYKKGCKMNVENSHQKDVLLVSNKYSTDA